MRGLSGEAFNLDTLKSMGQGLVRPECVLATRAGNFYTADFRGGVCKIDAQGKQSLILGKYLNGCPELKPNGIALLSDGDFLIAHLGDNIGGIYRLSPEGEVSPFVTHIDGNPLPPSNFIYLDHQGRLWLTVSTRQNPRAKGYRSDVSDGYIAIIENGKARIVADNIGYTNEVFVTPDGKQLYVNATFTRETLSYDIDADNNLLNCKIVASYGKGIFPDGLTMDTQGQLWVTSIVSNTVLRVDPKSGDSQVLIQDVDPDHLDWVEQAYQTHSMGRPHLDNVNSQVLQNISSLAFYSEDLSSIALGCLLGDTIALSASPYQGLPPAHWHFDDKA